MKFLWIVAFDTILHGKLVDVGVVGEFGKVGAMELVHSDHVIVIIGLSNDRRYLLGVRDNGNDPHSLTREELRTVVHEAGTRISSRYRDMLISILDLEKVTVDDVMVPHNEIVGIDLDDDDAGIEATIAKSQHTRLPVYRDNIDKVLGILHLRQFANLVHKGFDRATFEQLLSEPYFVPEGTPLSTQLVQFQRRRERIAMVVDEYGGTAGLVTLEDVVEEIVGEIRDEHEKEEVPARQEADGSWIVSAAAHVETLEELFGVELGERDFDTVGGLVVAELGRVPVPGDKLSFQSLSIEVLQVERRRILQVRVRPPRSSEKVGVSR